MLDGFQKIYSDSLLARQHQLNVSQQDVLTLASIIEAESGVMEDAGYLRRVLEPVKKENAA